MALTGLTFTALQSASLCLVTTPPERMAEAVGRALGPLRWVGVPVSELVLTVLLALRFMGTVRARYATPCHSLVYVMEVGWHHPPMSSQQGPCVVCALKSCLGSMPLRVAQQRVACVLF